MDMLDIVNAVGRLVVVLENNHFAAVVLLALAAIFATVWRRPAKE